MVKPVASARLLVVEDERNIGTTLSERLRAEGYEVAWATTAEEARFEIDKRRFDLAILEAASREWWKYPERIRNGSTG